MPSDPDPHLQQRRHRRRCAALALALVAAAAWWAAGAPALAEPPDPVRALPAPAAAAPAVAGHAAAAWNVALWRPLSDAPPAAAAAAPQSPLKLVSIMRRGAAFVAAIDPGDGGALVFARAGDRVHGVLVAAVDGGGAELQVDGRRQRLELAR